MNAVIQLKTLMNVHIAETEVALEENQSIKQRESHRTDGENLEVFSAADGNILSRITGKFNIFSSL